jgi:hypothetical protein
VFASVSMSVYEPRYTLINSIIVVGRSRKFFTLVELA